MITDFFWLLYLLEKNQVFTETHFTSSNKLSFPAADIDFYDDHHIELNFMGLYGVDSPLPQCEIWKAYQDHENGEIIRGFLNLFNHRIYQLFYLALKKYQPIVNTQQYKNYLMAWSGEKAGAANLMGMRMKSRVGLKAILTHYFKNIAVEVVPFKSQWIKIIPEKSIRLGINSLLGEKLLDLNGRIVIKIGPITLEKYLLIQQDKKFLNIVARYISPASKVDIDFLIQFNKTPGDLFHLGWTSWLLDYKTSSDNIWVISRSNCLLMMEAEKSPRNLSS